MAFRLNGKMIMVWFIAFIMLGSTLGYVFLSGFVDFNQDTLQYNGHSFSRDAKGLKTEIAGRQYYFTYAPLETKDVPMDAAVIQHLKEARVIYFTSMYNSTNNQLVASAEYDLNYFLSGNLNKIIVVGFADNNLSIIAPHIACSNATEFLPVVFFEDANATEIKMEGNCIRARAEKGEDFLIEKDRLLYGILGITDEQ